MARMKDLKFLNMYGLYKHTIFAHKTLARPVPLALRTPQKAPDAKRRGCRTHPDSSPATRRTPQTRPEAAGRAQRAAPDAVER